MIWARRVIPPPSPCPRLEQEQLRNGLVNFFIILPWNQAGTIWRQQRAIWRDQLPIPFSAILCRSLRYEYVSNGYSCTDHISLYYPASLLTLDSFLYKLPILYLSCSDCLRARSTSISLRFFDSRRGVPINAIGTAWPLSEGNVRKSSLKSESVKKKF